MRRLGQHFLHPAWAAKVAAIISPAAGETILEIGAGEGALTDQLAAAGATVWAIEIDSRLCEDLRRRFRDARTVQILREDILTVDAEALFPPGARIRVAGNLPYYISSPILFRLLDLRARIADATVMLQREVAGRVAAKPGGKEYGVLSVMLQLYTDVQIVLSLPPGAFRPPPTVESALVRLEFSAAPRLPVSDERTFARLVRAAFRERRKTLRNNLKALLGGREGAIDAALEGTGIDGTRRAETLAVSEFSALANFLVGDGGTAML